MRFHIIAGPLTAKLVLRFEAGPLFSRGYFLKCSHFAIAAKLHCPKGDRINESLLYIVVLYTVHNQHLSSLSTIETPIIPSK